jgi:Na+/proline symporter
VGTAVTILLGCVGYLAAQLLALGVLLEVLLGWDLATGVWVGLVVILAYSVSGGMVAGAWTDFAQGLLMLAAAVAVLIMTLGADGGVGPMARSIASSEAFGPRFFAPFAGSTWSAASLYLVFSIGTLAQPQILHKIMMVRDVGRLRWLPLALGGSQLVCLGVWLGFGLLVPAAVAAGTMTAVASVDQAVPAYLTAVAPRAVAGLVLVAVVAAIMSTADSFLNLAAGALRYDLPRALRWRIDSLGAADAGALERRAVRGLRWTTLWVGLAAGALAVGYGDLIALLGTFAFGTFAAGLVPALVVGLNWPGVSPRAAALSIWTGLVVSVALEMVRRGAPELWSAVGLPAGLVPAAVALLVSLATLFVASGLDRRPRPLDALSREILSM